MSDIIFLGARDKAVNKVKCRPSQGLTVINAMDKNSLMRWVEHVKEIIFYR